MATKHSRFGMSHVTVVPTNYRRDDSDEAADEDAVAADRS